ncbi:hypothetical protein RHGRI_011539 [Rhododendron griersonianum]|uniref:Uncharacterized protein n=1 Tax=Rhododendron griersonianum TaxID=479676 RepID=A0AAV6KN87_9ERIC|nr:hypothetical protein RHGRI_011539 [Rhododendron griersonianum]
MDEEAHQEKNRQVDEDETTRVQVNHDKVQQQLTIDSSRTAVSKELQENQNPDKGSYTGIDLNITPQQKPRRKKHRPKVILEGKPKRTTPKTHDKQGITMQMQKRVNNDLPSAPRSPNNSNCSSSIPCLTEEERARGLKRGHSYTTNEAENIRRNMIGGHFSSLDEYLAMFPTSACNNHGISRKLFPAIYKTKRTEKGHGTPTSSKPPTRGLKKKKEEERARGLKRGHSCTTNELGRRHPQKYDWRPFQFFGRIPGHVSNKCMQQSWNSRQAYTKIKHAAYSWTQ